MKELVDPGLSFKGEPSFSSTPTFNETLEVNDFSDLFTFTNLDFTESMLGVTLVQQVGGVAWNSETIEGKDEVFEACEQYG